MRYSLWFFLIFLVVFRFLTTRPIYKNGDKVRLRGQVSSEPTRYSQQQGLNLAGLKIYLPLYPEINYGDRIVVRGVVEDRVLKNAQLIRFEESKSLFFKVRKKLVAFYQSSLAEPHSALLGGVVLGTKASLPKDFWQALKKTGTAHVVVASGMNVTLVANFLISLLISFLPRKKAIPVALLGIWAYSFVSGFDAPIIRAAIMSSLAFSGQALGKLYQAWRALFLSAGVMLVVKPDWLFDLGFILSFAATASLMLFGSKIYRLIQFMPGIFREGLATSLAAQIGVAPLLYLSFGQFNLLTPLINALVLWTIPIMTVIGFVAGLLGLIVPFLGSLILFLCYPLTSWFISIVGLFG